MESGKVWNTCVEQPCGVMSLGHYLAVALRIICCSESSERNELLNMPELGAAVEVSLSPELYWHSRTIYVPTVQSHYRIMPLHSAILGYYESITTDTLSVN